MTIKGKLPRLIFHILCKIKLGQIYLIKNQLIVLLGLGDGEIILTNYQNKSIHKVISNLDFTLNYLVKISC